MGDLYLYAFPQLLVWVWVICAHFPRPGSPVPGMGDLYLYAFSQPLGWVWAFCAISPGPASPVLGMGDLRPLCRLPRLYIYFDLRR